MLFMKMDLLNYQYLDKMNNNIGILCYEGEAALRGEPRMQTLPVASALTSHRTGPPPISPSKRKFSVEQGDDDLDCENDHASKMSRIFNPHLNKTANGDCRKDPRERSRSPIERAVAPTMSLHGNHLYTSLPSLSMEQPLALTKNSMDASRPAGISPTLTPVERQQVGLCPVGFRLVVDRRSGGLGTTSWLESGLGEGRRGWGEVREVVLSFHSVGERRSGSSSRGPFTECHPCFNSYLDLPGPLLPGLTALDKTVNISGA